MGKVKDGQFQLAFFLPPVTVGDIKDVVFAGGRMPQKSSYFYPKPLSGLVMRDLKDAV